MSASEDKSNAHTRFLSCISSLKQFQHIRESSRNEPKQQGEFFFKKDTTNLPDDISHKSVGTKDVVQLLTISKKYIDTGKKIKNVHTTKKILKKPLEQLAADRIKRTIEYGANKKKLLRWDAVVSKFRSSESQVFPFQEETTYVNAEANACPLKISISTDLSKSLATADTKLKVLKETRDNTEKVCQKNEVNEVKMLSKNEIINKRKELAYIKMRESQKSAKARLQNKIKSKKYHNLLKRQRMLERIREYETLQNCHPNVALRKLNVLERSRILERANLRHKKRGNWTNNLKMRVKFNNRMQNDLLHNIANSQQLIKQKIRDKEINEEKDQIQDRSVKGNFECDPFNPWTKSETTKNSITDPQVEVGNSQWHSYWISHNEHENLLNENLSKQTLGVKHGFTQTSAKSNSIETGWRIEQLDNVNHIFDNRQNNISNVAGRPILNLSRNSKFQNNTTTSLTKSKKKYESTNLKDLSFKNPVRTPELDEELNPLKKNQSLNRSTMFNCNFTAGLSSISEGRNNEKNNLSDETVYSTDLSKLASVNLKPNLDDFNGLGCDLCETDLITNIDLNESSQQQLTIGHAFEDDNINIDFSMNKTTETEATNAEILPSMPGWGSWAGMGIINQKGNTKTKFDRLILKPASKKYNKYKDGIFINEDSNKLLRTHLVASIPFPFISLKDYEANTSSHIGRYLMPQSAFRVLTRPGVIVRKGCVIEPMNKSNLINSDI